MAFPKNLNTHIKNMENKVEAAERVLPTFVIGLAVLSICIAFCLRLTDFIVLIFAGEASECEH